ncbi:hypothetical protein DYB26_011516 [Aphanomyces astaci]|uniref:GAG-pre-integrase domain-containing protein n=2 Tax=Aphanomyces astaci TaxID=112090 RepID=A0A397FBW5_APHAT|nr:hypothetical protein DYB38_011844 [Aphanomyces astaci]RHY83052.1 hypothetical protein DYB26_011516 [Aphanomyces astaci]RHZ14525.1 hypothetical protein DYB31_012243 [Aphanomyces astaci]
MKRKAETEQLLYTDKPDKPRPFKKQAVKDKCHYCHKIGHHAFECRYKKRDLAKGVQRKCMPIEGDDQINVLQHDEEEGFILATIDDIPRSDLEDVWILDSACTAHVTGNKALFTKLARTQLFVLQLTDNSTVQSMHLGLLSIQVDADHRLDRPKTKFVPNFKKNLLSFRLLLRDGFQVAKWDLDMAIMILDRFVLKFTHHRGLYVLQPYEEHINSCLVRQSKPKLILWNLRLAHLNFAVIKQAARDGTVECPHLSKSDLAQGYSCEVCGVAKARRMSYKNTNPYRAHVPLQRIHIDKGTDHPPTFGGKMHYELFVDEGSRYKWLFLLALKPIVPVGVPTIALEEAPSVTTQINRSQEFKVEDPT